MLEEKMVILKKQLVEYAGLVENMVDKSIKGLIKKDKLQLIEVIEKDESKANNLEIELEEFSITLIAQYAPKGKDLRTILMALKMDNDFERIGDHAVNIAQSSLFLIENSFLKLTTYINKMSEVTLKMFSDSIKAFIDQDVEMAKNVCERDSIVDKLGDDILLESKNYMGEDPSMITASLNLIRIAQNLERIADLSTNICEEVIYMSLGRVIKHRNVEKEF